MITTAKWTAALVVGCALGANAFAAPINYGDFAGTSVTYGSVTENSFTDPTPLYGAPSISGNLLDFDPSAFGSASTGGASDFTDGQLNFTIDTAPGAGLTGFSVVEGGDYSFAGVTPTPGTFVSASSGVTVTILEVDGSILAVPINVFASDIFVSDYPTTGGAPSTGVLPWSLVTFVDLSSVLPSGSAATSVEVVIDNVLITGTTQGNTALITKKDFKIIPISIPEPGSLALLGLGGLLMARRRRV